MKWVARERRAIKELIKSCLFKASMVVLVQRKLSRGINKKKSGTIVARCVPNRKYILYILPSLLKMSSFYVVLLFLETYRNIFKLKIEKLCVFF